MVDLYTVKGSSMTQILQSSNSAGYVRITIVQRKSEVVCLLNIVTGSDYVKE